MVVVCSNCQTKFQLDDSKITEKGVKVRCSKCQNTFTVRKPGVISEPPPMDDVSADAGPAQAPQGAQGPGPDQLIDDSFSDSFSGDLGSADPSPGPGQDAPGSEARPVAGEPSFSFESEHKDFTTEQGGGSPFDSGSAKQDEFNFDDSQAGPSFEGFDMGSGEQQAPGSGQAMDDASQAMQTDETSFADLGMDLDTSKGPELEPRQKEELKKTGPVIAKADFPTHRKEPAPKPAPKKSPVTGYIMFSLLLIAAMYGGYFIWENRANFGFDKPAAAIDESRTKIVLEGINHYFLQNVMGQRMLVITGTAENGYSIAQSFILIKGRAFSTSDELLMEHDGYAGNIFSEDQLRILPQAEVEAKMNNKVGESLSNFNIPSQKTIPFMIVFYNTPDGVSKFGVEVVSSQSAAP
jgi:predicted Zn finger-like uncharacterized protein